MAPLPAGAVQFSVTEPGPITMPGGLTAAGAPERAALEHKSVGEEGNGPEAFELEGVPGAVVPGVVPAVVPALANPGMGERGATATKPAAVVPLTEL